MAVEASSASVVCRRVREVSVRLFPHRFARVGGPGRDEESPWERGEITMGTSVR